MKLGEKYTERGTCKLVAPDGSTQKAQTHLFVHKTALNIREGSLDGAIAVTQLVWRWLPGQAVQALRLGHVQDKNQSYRRRVIQEIPHAPLGIRFTADLFRGV